MEDPSYVTGGIMVLGKYSPNEGRGCFPFLCFALMKLCINEVSFGILLIPTLKWTNFSNSSFSLVNSLRVIRSKYGQYSRVLSVWLSVRRCSMSMPGYCTTCPLVLRLCLHSSPFSSSSSSSTVATASAFATGRRSAVDTG
ncbi:hypothetical protein T12_15533 [Trichinella patagoniensis]|uniref:Uncharacterized protein n=1 Tax=Trichinella patagoniensis TaxID=990121 RepID=A0A0V0ZI47_9BILA|nr:hypothetical protein T12_15533 [Trichinella patagoniensis]